MNLIFREAKNLRKSNAPWAGNVPDYWSAASLRWKTRIYAGGTPDKSKLEFWENGTIPWLNSGSVNQYVIKKPSALITEEALKRSSTRWVPKGALLLALAGQGKTKGMSARLAIESTCNQSVAAIVPNWDLNGIFLHYFLQDNYQNIRNLAGGDLRDGLNLEMLASIICPFPPLSEQRQIAAYLNRETAKIDKLIAKQQKLIKLLQEKRQAVISRAVTKGLDPNVKMKDSRVEWLGEVPEHWKVQKLRWIFRLVSEQSDDDHGMQLLSVYTDIGVKPRAELEARGNKASNTDGYWIVKKGDVIVNKLLAWMGALGVSEYDGVTSPAYDILRPRTEISSRFFSLIFRSGLMQTEIKRYSKGIMEMRLRIYFDQLGNLLAPVPSYEEQCQIVEHVQKVIVVYERLEERAFASINLLKEHRQALITAAVTGKIDVRGLVTDEEVAALDADPVLETTEEDFESEVVDADYITEEE